MTKTVSFSKDASNIFFHILTQCNLSCRHCYINPKQHGDLILPVEIIEKWLEALLEINKAANLILLGGEPTLHPGLDRVIKSAREMGYRSITVDTNGCLFHDILDKIKPGDLDFFSFSLDGATPATNDRMRGNGCYQTCISGIRKATGLGFNTSLIYTVSKENIHELEAMPHLLKDLGIDRFFIQVIGIRGKSATPENKGLQVDRDTWVSLIPEVARRTADLGITVTYPKVFLNDDDPFECAGRVAENYFIFPNGRVYRCPLCEDFPLHSLKFENNRLQPAPRINEQDLFALSIPEGCVMNRLVQAGNLSYSKDGTPAYRIACCMLKEELPGKPL